jgi:hypothetical protein
VSAAPPPPQPTVLVRVETEPPGARVREDGITKCKATPCEIQYVGGDPAAEHLLELTKSGYRREMKAVVASGDAVHVKMKRQ